jgi:hypothetical protein
VITTLRFVVVPEQIVFEPLNVALLGEVFTVTVVLLPATPKQFASWILVI